MRKHSYSNSPLKFNTVDQGFCDDILPILTEKKHRRLDEDASTIKNNKLLFRFNSAEPNAH